MSTHTKAEARQIAAHGALVLDIEMTALYTLAARQQRKALSILTCVDHLKTGKNITSDERERGFANMIELTFETATTT